MCKKKQKKLFLFCSVQFIWQPNSNLPTPTCGSLGKTALVVPVALTFQVAGLCVSEAGGQLLQALGQGGDHVPQQPLLLLRAVATAGLHPPHSPLTPVEHLQQHMPQVRSDPSKETVPRQTTNGYLCIDSIMSTSTMFKFPLLILCTKISFGDIFVRFCFILFHLFIPITIQCSLLCHF